MLGFRKKIFNNVRQREVADHIRDRMMGTSQQSNDIRHEYWYDLGVYTSDYSTDVDLYSALSLNDDYRLSAGETYQPLTRWLIDEAEPKLSMWAQDKRSLQIRDIQGNEMSDIFAVLDFLEDDIRKCLSPEQITYYWKQLLLTGAVGIHYSEDFGVIIGSGRNVYSDVDTGITAIRKRMCEDNLMEPDGKGSDRTLVFVNYEDDQGNMQEFYFEETGKKDISKSKVVDSRTVFYQCYGELSDGKTAVGVPNILDSYERSNLILQKAIRSRYVKVAGPTIILPLSLKKVSNQGEDLYKDAAFFADGMKADAITTLPTHSEDLLHLERREATLRHQAQEATGLFAVSYDEIMESKEQTAYETKVIYQKSTARYKALHDGFMRILGPFMKQAAYYKYGLEINILTALNPVDDEKRLMGTQMLMTQLREVHTLDPTGKTTGLNIGRAYRELMSDEADMLHIPRMLFDKVWPSMSDDQEERAKEEKLAMLQQASKDSAATTTAQAQKTQAETNRITAQEKIKLDKAKFEVEHGVTLFEAEKSGLEVRNTQLIQFADIKKNKEAHHAKLLDIASKIPPEHAKQVLEYAQQFETAIDKDVDKEISDDYKLTTDLNKDL